MQTPKQTRGHDAKVKIINTALKLFAEQGYTRTSTRDIARMADVNLSAIKYYFDDKEGLYKAAYNAYCGSPKEDISLIINTNNIDDLLDGLFLGLFSRVKKSEYSQYTLKLHLRELIEPTGVWTDTIENEIKPHHTALFNLIRTHVPNIPEKRLNRLVFSLIGMVIFLHVGKDVINAIDPSLLSDEQELTEWRDQMISYAKAIITKEKGIYEN